jgi:hypothetical protein
MRAAIIQAVFAAGSAKIVGYQTTRSKFVYHKFSHIIFLTGSTGSTGYSATMQKNPVILSKSE